MPRAAQSARNWMTPSSFFRRTLLSTASTGVLPARPRKGRWIHTSSKCLRALSTMRAPACSAVIATPGNHRAAGGLLPVVFERNVLFEGGERLAVLSEPGLDESEVEPGSGVGRVRAQLLERGGELAQLGTADLIQHPVPGFASRATDRGIW